jgi:hypothetical protein
MKVSVAGVKLLEEDEVLGEGVRISIKDEGVVEGRGFCSAVSCEL